VVLSEPVNFISLFVEWTADADIAVEDRQVLAISLANAERLLAIRLMLPRVVRMRAAVMR
jgi:hypothetical protein